MSAEANLRVSQPSDHALIEGVVVLTDERVAVVRTDAGDLRAERAASCLLEPQPLDRVLVARAASADYVLAVLVRGSSGTARLSTEGPVELCSRAGTVTVLGREGVRLVSPQRVSVATGELGVVAESAKASIDTLSFVGKLSDLSFGVLRTVAEKVERVAGRAVERLGRSYRFIEEAEHLRARELDVRAEATLGLRAENAVVMARKVVKMDGTQIHMG